MVLTVVRREDICQGFSELGITLNNEDEIVRLQEFCQNYNKDAISLADEWFAFITSTHLDSQPNKESLTKFESDRLIDPRKHIKTPKTPIITSRTPIRHKSANNTVEGVDNLLKAYGTPELLENCHSIKKQRTSTTGVVSKDEHYSPSSISDSPKISSQDSIYSSRSQSGDVVNTFGNTEIDWTNVNQNNDCAVSFYDEENALTKNYKYMFEKRRLTSIAINTKIELMEDVYKAVHDIEEFANLAQLSAEQVDIVGQISCDGNGRLNLNSVVIEGSHGTSDGNVAPLTVSNLPSFSFFPGQIAALQAINSNGQRWIANLVHSAPFPPLPSTTFTFANRNENLNCIIAAGPYTTMDCLSYKPLGDLLNKVIQLRPHICVLIGPFVDIRRKENEGEMVDITYEELFGKCMKMISECANSVNTKFVVVSSINDAHHEGIYPTPPFMKDEMTNIFFVSDPSIMNFDGVVFGITATDILFHLGKEEIAHPPGSPDRLGRLAAHLLLQRSFYPLYPPGEGMNINMEKLQKHAHLPVTPHILILPSDFSSFIKNINGCCCINPRRLTCGIDGGTYAHVIISANATENIGKSILDNVSAKVVRI